MNHRSGFTIKVSIYILNRKYFSMVETKAVSSMGELAKHSQATEPPSPKPGKKRSHKDFL